MPRKRIEIDWTRVADLCRIGCTLEEIADVLEVSHDTIERACWRDHKKAWGDLYRQWYNSKLRESLRRKMFEKAMKGDTIMQIYLSKQYLGMSDSPIIQQTVEKEVQYSFMQNFFPPQQAPAQIEASQQVLALPESTEEYRNVAVIPDNQTQGYDETHPDSIFAKQ